MKRFCFDIDGTICTNTWGKYEEAEPYFDRIESVNNLYDNGYHIIYFTARGMGRFNGNIENWDIGNVNNMSNMFFECYKFILDI